MKTINRLLFSVIIAVSTGLLVTNRAFADAMAVMEPPPVQPQVVADPNVVFFQSLSKCVAGVYQETNILSESDGPDMLMQEVVGMGKEGCHVILSTPDGRHMDCNFAPDALDSLADPHFIQGIVVDTVSAPTKEAIHADILWSQLKNDSCGF